MIRRALEAFKAVKYYFRKIGVAGRSKNQDILASPAETVRHSGNKRKKIAALYRQIYRPAF